MKIIYSLKIMNKLVEKGHVPVQTMPNPKNTFYNCWIFEVNPQFQQDLDEIMEDCYGKK